MAQAARKTRERTFPRGPRRGLLNRQGVLAAALDVVDEEGLDALRMRRLGAELGVEAMALYRYVPGKGALLDGLAELLWSRIPLPEGGATWKTAARAVAAALRGLAHAHPNAFPLLLNRPVLPEPALRLFVALIDRLDEAGFDEDLAGQMLGSLIAYAAGYGMVEMTCGLGRSDLAVQRCVSPATGGRFAHVARTLGKCDPEAQFTFGLSALLNGFSARVRARRSRR